MSLLKNTVSYVNNSVEIVSILGFILAIIGSVLIYVLFLRKDNEEKLTGFTKWLYDFLHFNKLCIEGILKFTYLFFAIDITVLSFGLISTSFIEFIIALVLGNLFLRIAYEMLMLLISIHRNIREINDNNKKKK